MARSQIECTPEGLVDVYPCLNCASDSQLDMMLMWLWTYAAGYTLPDDLDTVQEAAKCLACMSPRQIKQAQILLFAAYLGVSEETVTEIFNAFKCLPCMKPQQIRAIKLAMVCELLAGGQD